MSQSQSVFTTDASERVMEGLTADFGAAPERRAAHAKGVVAYGAFVPSADADSISRAAHFTGGPTDVVARFSNFPGGPPGSDVDPGANPRGLAVQFRLRDGSTTDLLAHSIDGFPGATIADFADFLEAIGPNGPGPESYLAEHAAAAAFVNALHAHGMPRSYATLRYYAVNAFVFHNADGVARPGRYVWRPSAGIALLDDTEVARADRDYLSAELADRLRGSTVDFHLDVVLADPGDVTDDANAHWPADRRTVTMGTLQLSGVAADSDLAQQGLFFDPVRLVDGITTSDDPLLLGRTRTYPLSLERRHHGA
jgi:catalase